MKKKTKCIVCGKLMNYKTKKPLRCSKCKKSKRKKGYSKERHMFIQLERLLPTEMYIQNGYYSFLRSPKNAPMQLDIYFPELQLAFEYDGIQHRKYSKKFFKSKSQFAYIQKCDKEKDKQCKKLNITLIRINDREKITKQTLIEKIKKYHRNDVIKLIDL